MLLNFVHAQCGASTLRLTRKTQAGLPTKRRRSTTCPQPRGECASVSRACAVLAQLSKPPTSLARMRFISACLVSLLTLGSAFASSLTLQSPRFTISSADATQLRAEPYVSTSQCLENAVVLTPLCLCRLSTARKPSALSLGPKDVLKVTFQVVDEEGKGVQPHQTFLRFYDEVSGEEGVQPVKVTAGGKAKFELVSHVVRMMWAVLTCPWVHKEHGQTTNIHPTHNRV